MKKNKKVVFGEYVEALRLSREKSLRETAKAIGVSPQFYSEVEKGRGNALVRERLISLRDFLVLTEDEADELFERAADARSDTSDKQRDGDVIVPQDCADYVANNPYVVEALRLSKETGAGEEEWQILLEELRSRKG